MFLIVLDGVGMGALPDAGRYGDAGAKYRMTEAVGAGAFYISGGLGVAGIHGEGSCTQNGTVGYSYCSSVEYVGPALRVGLEWRL